MSPALSCPPSSCQQPQANSFPNLTFIGECCMGYRWERSCVYSSYSLGQRIEEEKKLLPRGSADREKLKTARISPPFNRLRTHWHLQIPNKTANWISHHYTPTHYAQTICTAPSGMKTIAFCMEDDERIDHLSFAAVRRISTDAVGCFVGCLIENCESWSNGLFVTSVF